jgi:hypothetical protein
MSVHLAFLNTFDPLFRSNKIKFLRVSRPAIFVAPSEHVLETMLQNSAINGSVIETVNLTDDYGKFLSTSLNYPADGLVGASHIGGYRYLTLPTAQENTAKDYFAQITS